MAFPTVAATNTSTSAATTSHTVSLPASISAGDLLFIFFCVQEKPNVTTPSGWTLLKDMSNVADASRLTVFYKVASGSEGSTVSITTSASWLSAHCTYRITGYTGTPEVSTGSNATPLNADSLTPSGGTKDYLWIAVGSGTNAAANTLTGPTSYTVVSAVNSTSPYPVIGASYRQLNASSEDPGAFGGFTGSYGQSCTVAVFPEITGPETLKTLNTIAKASIKTVDTVAIASVKTIDTIT